MLTEKEKEELLEMSRSKSLREDFRRLREGARLPQPVDLDLVLKWLTFVSSLAPAAPRPLPKPYPKALL